MDETEEFEFRLRLEKELQAKKDFLTYPNPRSSGLMPKPKGVAKGGYDPGTAVTKFALRTGPGVLNENVAQAYDQRQKRLEEVYQAQRLAHGDTEMDWDRMAAEAAVTFPMGAGTKPVTGALAGAGYSQMMTSPEENLNPPSSPAEYYDRQLDKGGVGAAMGAFFPLTTKALGSAARYAKRTLVDPWTEPGMQREANRFLRTVADEDKAKIVQAMQNAKERVPGTKPTAGQAIAQAQVPGEQFGPGMVKLEQELASKDPGGMPLRRAYAKQRQGRKDVLAAIEGTPEDMAKAKAELVGRDSIFSPRPMYEAAERSTANVTKKPVVKKIDDLIAKNPNEPDIVNPLNSLRSSLTDSGNSVTEMASLSRRIGKMMQKKNPMTGQNEYDVKALKAIKDQLDSQISRAERKWDVAQKLYARKMRPIHRMNTGKTLREALIASSQAETPAAYQKAMSDAQKTLKKATKFKRHTEFANVLTTKQAEAARQVGEELSDELTAKGMISKPALESVLAKLPSEMQVKLPQVLSRPIVITNHFLTNMFRNAKPKYQKLLAETMKDPKALEMALQEPVDSEGYKIAKELLRNMAIYSGVKGAQEQDVSLDEIINMIEEMR